MKYLNNINVLIGIAGGIAAYKSAELAPNDLSIRTNSALMLKLL